MTSLSTFAHELHERLQKLSRIALIAHKAPDGDALGSIEGMRQLLVINYPQLHISVVVPPEKTVDSHITWVLGETVETVPEADLTLIIDTSLWSRTALGNDLQPLSILSIDHHELQPESIPGYLDTGAPSASIIITDIARELGWTFSPDAATALLLGIYTDTGGFIHRNSNQRAFETASFLIGQGAEQSRIAIETFGNYTLEYLHNLGRGLLSIVQDGTIACLFFEETPNNIHLKSHIIGYLSGLHGVDIACVLMKKGNEIKGSFRTRKDGIDVNEMAKQLGGGGHKKAAGFTLDGDLSNNVLIWHGKNLSPLDFIGKIRELINK